MALFITSEAVALSVGLIKLNFSGRFIKLFTRSIAVSVEVLNPSIETPAKTGAGGIVDPIIEAGRGVDPGAVGFIPIPSDNKIL